MQTEWQDNPQDPFEALNLTLKQGELLADSLARVIEACQGTWRNAAGLQVHCQQAALP